MIPQKLKLLITISMIMKVMENTVVNIKDKEEVMELFTDLNVFN